MGSVPASPRRDAVSCSLASTKEEYRLVPARKLLLEEALRETRRARRVRPLSPRERLRSYLTSWAVVVVAGLLVCSRYAAVAAADYRIDQLTAELHRLQAANARLDYRWLEETSPARLAVLAKGLHLVQPTSYVILPSPRTSPGRPTRHVLSGWRGLAQALSAEVRRAWAAFTSSSQGARPRP